MSKNPPSKDEALEALDFIVNVLKEHEKDLDRLIGELGTVTGQLGETGELGEKVGKIEQKIDSLQTEIGSLLKRFANQPQEKPVAPPGALPEKETKSESTQTNIIENELPIVLQCKQWEDFQALSSQAQTVSFTYKETDHTFEAEALKNGRVITYKGELPKFSALMKTWLGKQLEILEKRILEGQISLG